MSTLVAVLASTLVFCFVICCVVSAALQILAWSRHAREGAPVTLKALWRPEGYFDEIGMRQIVLARRLLTVGGWAYLTYGLLIVVSNVF
jgi:hypothetical protein